MKKLTGKFFTKENTVKENEEWGVHSWYSRPDITESEDLMVTRVDMPPGKGHAFHTHPNMDEVIYVISGQAEQWIEQEKKHLTAGESAFIPKDMVHATFNTSDEPLSFLAILGPADKTDRGLVDVSGQEPWKSLKDS
jgi:quercetin dioxygenase-like cupin family protein